MKIENKMVARMNGRRFIIPIMVTLIIFAGQFSPVFAPPPPIFSDAQDGEITSNGFVAATGAIISVGDINSNNYNRGFFKFSLSGISGIVTSAILNLFVFRSYHDGILYDTGSLTNPGLGDCLVIHIDDYGALDSTDFNAASIGNDPGVLIQGTTTPTVGYVSINIQNAVQDDIDNGRDYSSFMVKMQTDTDNDGGKFDLWSFSSSEEDGTSQDPYISVVATRHSIDSIWTNNPPSIDGIVQGGEWSNVVISFTEQYDSSPTEVVPTHVYMMNDATNLYVLVDALGDTTDNTDDECLLVFDCNSDPTDGFKILSIGGTSDPSTWHGASGFIAAIGYSGTHKVYEFSIPFSLIGGKAGDSFDLCSPYYKGMGSISYDGDNGHDNVWPPEIKTDQTLWRETISLWGILNTKHASALVGGVTLPVNTLAILTPYLTLAGLVITVSAVIVIKRRKN